MIIKIWLQLTKLKKNKSSSFYAKRAKCTPLLWNFIGYDTYLFYIVEHLSWLAPVKIWTWSIENCGVADQFLNPNTCQYMCDNMVIFLMHS